MTVSNSVFFFLVLLTTLGVIVDKLALLMCNCVGLCFLRLANKVGSNSKYPSVINM